MKAATVGQREQAIKAGNIRPGFAAFKPISTAAAMAKSRAMAIAARRKELAK